MFRLPLFHDLRGVPCLVVGGGVTALRKTRWLVRTGADITVLSPVFNETFETWAEEGRLSLIRASYSPERQDAAFRLVIAATDDSAVNTAAFARAEAQAQLINCVDDPSHCNVTFPAIVDRYPLIVAISSMGQAPALSRITRGWIEERLPAGLGAVAERVASLRDRIKERFADIEARTHAYNRLISSRFIAAVEADDEAQIEHEVEAALTAGRGSVALIGAGPGDPELITLKGLRRLQTADVVLYDQLANERLLDYARRDAELIYVGKQGPKPGEGPERKNNRGFQQQTINDLIVEHALAGADVVRLKGGDPFIYGRGGEEIDALAEAGFDVEVIPGITAALGAASYAGIPLTHREHAQSVRFVTGHRVENVVNLDWPELGKGDQTLVIYMGLVGLEQIADRLIEHGAPRSRPAALIEHATLPNQRVVAGPLAEMAKLARQNDIRGPTVVIIGDVVGDYVNAEPLDSLTDNSSA